MSHWRLGLDIGTNSIGWAALALDGNGRPAGLIDAGVRIFSDGRNPKDRQSNAVKRRLPRQARRNRDRYLKRRDEFIGRLIEHGLMPADDAARKALERLDPWALRIEGLDKKLTLHELGRALFHLQQRRGFQSNRVTDAGDDDAGKIADAANRLTDAMAAAGARTLAELLAGPRLADPKKARDHAVRARLKGAGAQAHYDFYPTRDLIAAEFDALWAAQGAFHGAALDETARQALRDTLLYQRPLKAQPVGKCALDPTEPRAPWALPSAQRLRIWQEVNNLRVRLPGVTERKLSAAERDALTAKALATRKLTFDAARKALKLPDEARFSLESERRKHLDGDLTAAVLAAGKCWGKAWRSLPLAEQDAVVERLLAEQDEAALIAWLAGKHGLAAENAGKVAGARLPQGHGNLGRTAAGKVLEWLSSDMPKAEWINPRTGEVKTLVAPFTYDQSVVLAGYPCHSDLDRDDGEGSGKPLPYYGQVLERHVAFGSGEPGDPVEKRLGKIANPTVHVALNQLRRVVNALMERLGPPAGIVVELARDLPLSAEGKSKLDRTMNENKARNDARRVQLKKLGQADTYENRLRLRLWEELNRDDPFDRRCPYSGEQIGIERLFSAEVDLDHILPLSRTLDDSPANKILCARHANRFKGARTPHEAFGSSPAGYDWNGIAARAAALSNNKAWRFAPDAMDKFENEERDFLARQLVDTRYMSRLATAYLKRTVADVWVTPGRLTSDLRWTWGLESVLPGHNLPDAAAEKNRNDHRHHAIDAVVVGLTDRGLLQAVATAAGRAEERFDPRYLAGVPDPWPDFRATVQAAVERLIVSHKPDHGVQGALHNDTAYGIVESDDAQGRSVVVHRVPLSTLSKPADLDAIRDPLIRERLKSAAAGLAGKAFTDAIVAAGEAMDPKVRKVRILETLAVIPVMDAEGRAYKAYKGDANYCYDIFVDAKGRWGGEIVSRFDANRPGFDPDAVVGASGKPLVMRLRNNDLLAVENGAPSGRRIMRVVKMSKGAIVLAEHHEAGPLKTRDADKLDSFKYLNAAPSKLQKLKARLVHVDPAGRVFDPGPPPEQA